MNPPILACDLHDHIEIICMRRYAVVVHQLDGTQLHGIAHDTRSTAGQEFLQLQQDNGRLEIPLLQIDYIEVQDDKAPLQYISLQQGGSCAI